MDHTKMNWFSRNETEVKGNVFDFSRTLDKRRQTTLAERDSSTEIINAAQADVILTILDEASINWSYSIVDIRQFGSRLMVSVSLTINNVTRDGIGTDSNNTDDPETAELSALVCAAKKFDFVREAISYRQLLISVGHSQTTQTSKFPFNPIAANLMDLLTACQFKIIRTLSNELGIDADLKCRKLLKCDVGELSKAAAESFINYLESMNSPIEVKTAMLRAG